MKYACNVLTVVSLGLISAQSSLAGGCTPPNNETCENAIVLAFDQFPLDISAPLGCFNDEVDRPYFDVFYQYDCTVSGDYLLEMCGSVGDTYLKIYSGGCGPFDGEIFAEGDDECPGGSPPPADPMITITLEAGTTYYFEIGSWRPDPPFAPPPNALYNFRVSFGSACIADLNGDGAVGSGDMAILLGSWGLPAAADLDGDGIVGSSDLALMLGSWGPCP